MVVGEYDPKDESKAMVAKLKKIREWQRLERPELADAAGVSVSSICNMERELAIPRLDTVIGVAAALGYKLALVRRLKSVVKTKIKMKDGTVLQLTFRDFDELSVWQAEHHQEIAGITARTVSDGSKGEEEDPE